MLWTGSTRQFGSIRGRRKPTLSAPARGAIRTGHKIANGATAMWDVRVADAWPRTMVFREGYMGVEPVALVRTKAKPFNAVLRAVVKTLSMPTTTTNHEPTSNPQPP